MILIDDPAALPPSAAALLGTNGFFSSAAWWRTVWEAGISPDASPLMALHGDGPAAVLFPLLRHDGGRMEALTNPYTCLYQPAAGAEANLREAGRALARLLRGSAFLRLDALDPDWPGLAPLLSGARAGGLVPLRFDHFGNWHEALAGRDWRGYLAGRPGALRETVRRRLRDAERDATLTFAVAATPAEVEAGIAEYEAVYARSWKEPEPFPRFNAVLMRHAAAAGWLRLGLLRRDGQAIAVQLWILQNGVAAVLKLAHDEAFKPLSPGTVLTAWMLRRLITGGSCRRHRFRPRRRPLQAIMDLGPPATRGRRAGQSVAPCRCCMLLRHGLGRLRQAARALRTRPHPPLMTTAIRSPAIRSGAAPPAPPPAAPGAAPPPAAAAESPAAASPAMSPAADTRSA